MLSRCLEFLLTFLFHKNKTGMSKKNLHFLNISLFNISIFISFKFQYKTIPIIFIFNSILSIQKRQEQTRCNVHTYRNFLIPRFNGPAWAEA